MTTIEKTKITVRAIIHAPVKQVWDCWTDPKHIIHWNNASDDWHTPRAVNNLQPGGKLLWRMEAKDGSWGFDFSGVYNKIKQNKLIECTLDDGRDVQISFVSKENETIVTEIFEAEQTNTLELQQTGWQSILNNFKNYVESLDKKDIIHFEITINAKAEKVYKTMIDEKKWMEWTAEFSPASQFKGSWEKGSKILFLGTDQDGNFGGMVSRINENIPNRYICIEHRGIIKDDKEIMSGPEVEPWQGALECYSFSDDNGKTLLTIKMETQQKIQEEFKSYFATAWPKALNTLKMLCEN